MTVLEGLNLVYIFSFSGNKPLVRDHWLYKKRDKALDYCPRGGQSTELRTWKEERSKKCSNIGTLCTCVDGGNQRLSEFVYFIVAESENTCVSLRLLTVNKQAHCQNTRPSLGTVTWATVWWPSCSALRRLGRRDGSTEDSCLTYKQNDEDVKY